MPKRTRTVAPHGKKTIEVTLRFWADGISRTPGTIDKKECWDAGVVYLKKNAAHGIQSTTPIPFNSLLQLPAKLEKLLITAGITLHLGNTSSKYTVKT